MLCNKGYLSETHLKLKSCDIWFVHKSSLSRPIVLQFCTEHGRITGVLCAKFLNVWTIETDVIDERDFTRFEFKMIFGRISYIAQHAWYHQISNRNDIESVKLVSFRLFQGESNQPSFLWDDNLGQQSLYLILLKTESRSFFISVSRWVCCLNSCWVVK